VHTSTAAVRLAQGVVGLDPATWPTTAQPTWMATGDVEIEAREAPLTLHAGSILVEVQNVVTDYRDYGGIWIGPSRLLVITNGALRGTVLSVGQSQYWDDSGALLWAQVWPVLLEPSEPRPVPADLLVTQQKRA
jgi:hypothetical protein